MAGSLYQRFNTVSQGLNGMPSLSRTQGENADFDLARHDMNGVGSPSVMPSNVLSDPKMDAFFDSVNDAAGDKPVKFGYADSPNLPPSMEALFAPTSPLSNDADWYKQAGAQSPFSLGADTPLRMGSRQLGSTPLPRRQKFARTEDN